MASYIVSKMQLLRDRIRRGMGILLFDLEKKSQLNSKNIKSVLFIRHDAKLGDAIVSSCLIRKLKKYRPDIKQIVLTSKSMSSMFKDDFGVDEVIHMKKRPSYGEIRDICQKIGSVDMVVSLNQDMKMKDIYMLKHLQSSLNVGVDTSVKLININIKNDICNAHYSEKFDCIAKLVGIDEQKEPYIVPIKDEAIARVKQFLAEKGIGKFVLLNPFGSGNERKLSAEKINEILIEAQSKTLLPILILSAPDTRELLASMPIVFSDSVVHFDQSESIFDAIAAVKLCDLVITVDTSIVHIAAGLNKPQIAIYRKDDVNFNNWHPNSANAKVIIADSNINDFLF
ncbi:glycosyltransferase family 9 protein [Vibrio diazotrophicus]|uniref:glycosyltransferase family 9 protein n=1 Tax=Vibrio diazotrophicus TaxID=685 RepID=UPI00142D26C7|nr:glycosyltransferase family 9 protein [Vibrio diazotrophicus]NIY92976.1 glycosyltransferase family 9 protein [Vibrio diazotrophicus]